MTDAEIVIGALCFAAGFLSGVVALIAAQVREAKRRAAMSEVLDRRRVWVDEGEQWPARK